MTEVITMKQIRAIVEKEKRMLLEEKSRKPEDVEGRKERKYQ